MKHTTYAVIDIGSNSLRLMKGTRQDDGSWLFSPKELATTQLGKDIEKTNRLSKQGIGDSLAAMAAWQQELQSIPVCAVATSAVREAADGQEFLAEIRSRFGWHCRTLTGTEEAAFSFCGASSTSPQDGCTAVLDIGGGSTEVAVGTAGTVQWSHSYPLGAVRLTNSPVWTEDAVAAVRARCETQWLAMPKKLTRVIGVGGTLTTLAAMEQEMAVYDPARITGYTVTQNQLAKRMTWLLQMTPEERKHVPGLQPKRSDIILAGLAILQSFLQHYDIDAVQMSERDLLEGVFYKEAFQDGTTDRCCR